MAVITPVVDLPTLTAVKWESLDGGDTGSSVVVSSFTTVTIQAIRVSGSGTSGAKIQTSNNGVNWYTLSTGATSSTPDIGDVSLLGRYIRVTNENSTGTIISVYLKLR